MTTTADVKKTLEQLYDKQMVEDGALDLFDPSVELLVAPFYRSIRGSYTDVFVDKFAEYFTPKGDVWAVGAVATSSGTAPVAVVERSEVPMLLGTDCKTPINTWSIPRPCLRVQGKRGTYRIEFNQLFAGDLVWLYYHERMGVHRMVGALLDDFVTRGRFPLRPLGIDGLVLEGMVREVKAGLSSTVREREISYRRCLGWSSEAGGKLDNNSDAPMNHNFSTLFNRLVFLALGYYNEKRLAVAIQNSTTNAGKPSRATLISIKETIGQLRKACDPFKYGRNHTHTLSGIVWTLAGLELLLRLRSQLGIPEPYQTPDELIPAAYDLLVGPSQNGRGNRYTAHRDCAEAGRAVLLDVQGLDFDQISGPEADPLLTQWLEDAETAFELYRSAYRVLTNVDLGATSSAQAA
jgi:hypothetical protein